MPRRQEIRNRPDSIKPPDFEFCVVGRPVSAQASNRILLRQWKDQVATAARLAWPHGLSLPNTDVELRVTQYSELRIVDRDNMLKPIQDALQGVAYLDDRQVNDATCNWRNINSKFTIRSVSPILAMAFSRGEEFLHVRLWHSPLVEDLG